MAGVLMIQLQSIAVRNFRGIREGKIDGFTDVNLFVGRNNSGKTTLIEAITRIATIGGLRIDVFGRDVEQLWQQARSSGLGQGGVGGMMDDGQSLLWFRQDKGNEIALMGRIKETDAKETEELGYILRFPNAVQAHHGKNFYPESMQIFWKGITVFRPADAFNPIAEQRFWPQLLSNRRDRLVTKTLNDVFGLDAESFQLLPNNQFMVLFHDFSLPLDLQGDGTRAAMRALMTLSMLKGTLMMLEEPECHQHPGSLERFAAALCRLAKTQQVQLIISTHSAECVKSFLKAASAAESDAAVFHLTLADGKQDARRLDPEAVETLTTTGVDVRFLDLYA
jgi:AAA15 family ATPase/GTPase